MASLIDDEKRIFDEKIAILEATFGGTVSSVVITSVLESCGGDVNVAADAIMNFDNDMTQAEAAANESMDFINTDCNVYPSKNMSTESTAPLQPPITVSPISSVITAPSTSLSEAFRNTGAVPKRYSDTRVTKPQNRSIGPPDQIAKIIDYHSKGTRILILMRGAPGSGKTFLAKHIIDYTVGALSQNYSKHIYSSDNFFMRGGIYQFYQNGLHEAHRINQKKVCDASNKGLSPIIVDNTNTEIWEMEPYVRDGVRNGYIIEIIEPYTPWATNISQLSRRNVHGVPPENIQRMLGRYNRNITVEILMRTFGLAYPANKKPPVQRVIPEICPPGSHRKSIEKTVLNRVDYNKDDLYSVTSGSKDIFHTESPHSPDELLDKLEINDTACAQTVEQMPCIDDAELMNPEQELKLQKIIETQQNLKKIENTELVCGVGESLENIAANTTTVSPDLAIALDPKPPRVGEKNDTDKFIEPANICDDWRNISMFMPPWNDEKNSNSGIIAETPTQVETQSASTCFELGDLNLNGHKVLHGVSRNINATQCTNMPVEKKKLQKVVMLDTSTTTHENVILTETEECKYKENHFTALRRMFKIVPSHILRDIFDSCNGDVNWAVNIVLDSYPESQQNLGKHDASDSEEESIEGCLCLAAYNIIPATSPTAPISPVPENIPRTSTLPLFQRKSKRENKLSDRSLEVKRQIESNVIISDNHYSQHYLNSRRRRENITSDLDVTSGSGSTHEANNTPILNQVDTDNAIALPEGITSNKNKDIKDILKLSSSDQFHFVVPNETDAESEDKKSDVDQLVSLNVGHEFITKLEELYGTGVFPYPDYVQPTLNLPKSILDDIYRYWSESVATQIDDASKQSEAMIKQDEDFARQLAAKEEEMAKEGKEPNVPTMREIMDMEMAYSIYEKSVAEWRNKEPQDLAAKLSREKLYNLFPDISKNVLAELLMAHGYNFRETTQSLLVSTGQEKWLKVEQGVEKFVMAKEMERKDKFLEQQNRNIMETKWPTLFDSEKPVNLETVQFYRAEAERFLITRNLYYEKARSYYKTNVHDACIFYSTIAALHTRLYEHSNCLAVAYLTSHHLRQHPNGHVLDLHYLHVPEAIINLDIFLDFIILQIREKNIRCKDTWIITGKGNHSKGGPRIKPATKRHLSAREIQHKEVNAGLLVAKIFATHLLSDELARYRN